jgi:hypothetical protein
MPKECGVGPKQPKPLQDPPSPPLWDPPDEPMHDPAGDPTSEPEQPFGDPTLHREEIPAQKNWKSTRPSSRGPQIGALDSSCLSPAPARNPRRNFARRGFP